MMSNRSAALILLYAARRQIAIKINVSNVSSELILPVSARLWLRHVTGCVTWIGSACYARDHTRQANLQVTQWRLFSK
jgi:hypothetical protein